MNFSMSPKEIPVKEIVSRVENTIKDLDKPISDTIRAQISLTIQKADPPKANLSRSEKLALSQLKQDESIIILPADKGRATVILDKADYINKCNDHLDNGPYEKLKKDPTESTKKEVRVKLQDLKDQEIISNRTYYKIKPSDSPTPRFYGSPKIHKPGVPIRPIVSYIGSPLYDISKYLASILSHYTTSDNHHSKNSKEFSEYVRQLTIEDDEQLISFDVTSLYTNVPIEDTLVVIKDLLENDPSLKDRTSIPAKDLLELTRLVLTKTSFLFNGIIYKQTDGVAMGGPASSVVAEIFMLMFEDVALTTTDHSPKVWERHVDDCFLIIKELHLNMFFHHVNNLHPQIKFTMEREENGCLPFLDTLIKRNADKSISVSVYRKPTHTDQYLNFQSNHQDSAKESVISSLLSRAENIVSNEDDKIAEKQRVISVLHANNYSKKMIQKVQRKLERDTTRERTGEEEELVGHISLPYVKGVSETLRRIFSKNKIRCTFYTKDTIRNALSHPKDPVDKNKQNNIVYKIPCDDCNAVYIGESKRTLEKRASEHERAVRNGDLEKNKIAHHCWTSDHRFNFDNKTIIDRETNMTTRKIKETIHSISDPNHINSISYELADIWLPALNT